MTDLEILSAVGVTYLFWEIGVGISTFRNIGNLRRETTLRNSHDLVRQYDTERRYRLGDFIYFINLPGRLLGYAGYVLRNRNKKLYKS